MQWTANDQATINARQITHVHLPFVLRSNLSWVGHRIHAIDRAHKILIRLRSEFLPKGSSLFLFYPPHLPGSTELLRAVQISSTRFSNRLLKDLVGILNVPCLTNATLTYGTQNRAWTMRLDQGVMQFFQLKRKMPFFCQFWVFLDKTCFRRMLRGSSAFKHRTKKGAWIFSLVLVVL